MSNLTDAAAKKWFLIFVLSTIAAVGIFLYLTVDQIKNVPPIPKEVKGKIFYWELLILTV